MYNTHTNKSNASLKLRLCVDSYIKGNNSQFLLGSLLSYRIKGKKPPVRFDNKTLSDQFSHSHDWNDI